MPRDTFYDAMDEPFRMLDEFLEAAAEGIMSLWDSPSSSSSSSSSGQSGGGGYFCNVPSHKD